MKKVGDIMQELGFNKNASDSTKKAFLKHLLTKNVAEADSFDRELKPGTQLNFSFDSFEFTKKAS